MSDLDLSIYGTTTIGSPFYEELEWKECPACNGRGYTIWSCCGDDITDNINETDLCPTCLEHCGDEREDCEECNGEGTINV